MLAQTSFIHVCDMTNNFKAVLLSLTAFGIFATHDVVVKMLGGTYSAFQIVFFSVLLGFPLITIRLLRDETVGTLIPMHPLWTIIRTVSSVAAGVGAFFAFSLLPLAQTYAILFASPLLITLLAIPVLGENVGWRRLAAVFVGLVGVIVVLQPATTTLGIGHIAAGVSAIGGAFASIVVRKIGKDERSVVLIIYPMVANFVLMGALMPFVYKPMPFVDLSLSFVIAGLALIAVSCLIGAYKIGSAIIVAPMQYSQILWATLFGMIFFNEQPTWPTAIGATIIIASGIYIVLREDSGASENSPVLRTRSRSATPSIPRVSSMFRSRGEEPPQPKGASNPR